MKVNIEIKEGRLEVFEVVANASGWQPKVDPDNPSLNSPAVDINGDYSPPLEMPAGTYWLIKVNKID